MDGRVEVMIMLSELSDVGVVEAGAELSNICYIFYISLKFSKRRGTE